MPGLRKDVKDKAPVGVTSGTANTSDLKKRSAMTAARPAVKIKTPGTFLSPSTGRFWFITNGYSSCVYFFLHSTHEPEAGLARRRFSSISRPQYLQVPYVPLTILSRAFSTSRRVASRVRSSVRLVLKAFTSSAFSSSLSPRFWKSASQSCLFLGFCLANSYNSLRSEEHTSEL